MQDKVVSYQVASAYSKGKTYPSRRLSCVFSAEGGSRYDGGVPGFRWEQSSVLSAIRANVEALTEAKFDYALVHLYRDGDDSLGWHRDSEAMKTLVASVSRRDSQVPLSPYGPDSRKWRRNMSSREETR